MPTNAMHRNCKYSNRRKERERETKKKNLSRGEFRANRSIPPPLARFRLDLCNDSGRLSNDLEALLRLLWNLSPVQPPL